jgi:hypothetical protein
LKQLKELQAEGKLEVIEWPPAVSKPNVGSNNYNFENLESPHVVNCPTPLTIDSAIHRARKFDKIGKGEIQVNEKSEGGES